MMIWEKQLEHVYIYSRGRIDISCFVTGVGVNMPRSPMLPYHFPALGYSMFLSV
jgi:hypothetical protein